MIIQKVLSRQLRQPGGLIGVLTGLLMHRANGEMYHKVLSDTKIEDGDSILEIGFGSGKHIPKTVMRAAGITYAGIDISDTMIRYARSYNAGLIKQKQVELLKASISNIPFADNSFNRIVTINTIYFWGDVRRAMDEMIRVLKPGGTITIGANSKTEMLKQGYRSKYFNFWTKEEIEELITGSGLDILSSKYYRLQIEDSISIVAIKRDDS